MGKRSVRQIHLPMIRNNSVTYIKGSLTSYLMDNTFPEESNDSGLGSDTTFILTDSSGGPSSSESDMENGQDSSTDSGASNHPPIQGLLALLSKRRTVSSVSPQTTTDHDSDDYQNEPSAKKTRLEMNGQVLAANTGSLQVSNGNKQQEVLVVTTNGNVAAVHTTSPGCTLPAALPGLEQTVIGERISSLLVTSAQQPPAQQPQTANRKRPLKKPSLHQSFPCRSRDGKAELKIITQPEEQHRARYMTEGSRGSIKDERGSGFPTVKLCGVAQPVTLQVFIGTDQGKVQPHLFYQACKVTGKNCTPCNERVLDGTIVIEINMLPEAEMTVSCDCIGILKERNVDVEQRLPYFGLTRTKKKSTRCRMVFRVCVPMPNGTVETLQIASSQILCTQSPGLPEICKKSLTECPVQGDTDLFIIGKNFQKDTKIVFQEVDTADDDDSNMNAPVVWEESVQPEKEYFHQSHLVCRVPAYRTQGVTKAVRVRLLVNSGGKSSLPHPFYYTPVQQVVMNSTVTSDHHFKRNSTIVDNGMDKFCNAASDMSSLNIASNMMTLPTITESHLVKMEPLDGLSTVQMADINSDLSPNQTLPLTTTAPEDVMRCHNDSVIEDLQQRIEQLQEGRALNPVEVNSSMTVMAPEDVKAATEDCLNQLTMADVSVHSEPQQQVEPHIDLRMHVPMPMPAPVLQQDLSMAMNTMELPMMTAVNPVSQPMADVNYLNQPVQCVPKEPMCHDNGCTSTNTFVTNTCLATDTQIRQESAAPISSVMAVPAAVAPPAAQSTNQELNCFNQTMTLEFSQLSDADLLSLINPSTFDNGMFAWEQTNSIVSMI